MRATFFDSKVGTFFLGSRRTYPNIAICLRVCQTVARTAKAPHKKKEKERKNVERDPSFSSRRPGGAKKKKQKKINIARRE